MTINEIISFDDRIDAMKFNKENNFKWDVMQVRPLEQFFT